jgi:TolA-binding protein
VTVYYRAVKVDINYKIARLTDDSLIGQGTKSATSPRSTSENQSNLTPASELEAGAIKKPLGELAAEMVPTQRSITLTLAKESENKAAKKEMNAALKLVKAKDYKGAAAAYGKIYAQYNNFAAGYNQALLVEASDGTEAAVGLMEALIQKTGNATAQNMLRSMQSRNEANKRAAEQLTQ